MDEKEKDFIKKVNIDKAKKKTIPCIIIIVLSLLTYIEPFLFGEFDFGIIFECITLVFIIIARKSMENYNEVGAKRYVTISILSIGWLLIYDIINWMTNEYIIDIDFMICECFAISYLLVLLAINKDLKKADNPEKYKESMDWFYEKLDKEDKENK